MVDALVSNTNDFTVVRVRVSLPAPQHVRLDSGMLFFIPGMAKIPPIGLHWPSGSACFYPVDSRMALIVTQDGSHSIFAEQYGVTYHSKYGAVTESAHVFIDAGLRFKAVVEPQLAILEVGFGTGLNAFMTWLEAERRNLHVQYTTLEAYPIERTEARLFNFAEQLQVPGRQADFERLHNGAWGRMLKLSDHFTLLKKHIRLEQFRSPEAFDLIYFDAFAPQAQPELWTETIFERLFAALRPEGVLVTYCAKGNFKRTLKKVGFAVERLPGPPGKREMTRAQKDSFQAP